MFSVMTIGLWWTVTGCFDLQNGLPMDLNYDYQKCVGLKIKPRRGDGLLFYSLFPNGTIDVVSVSSGWHSSKFNFH